MAYKILIAEDDPSTRDMYVVTIREIFPEGLEIDLAKDGQELLEKARDNTDYAVIQSDDGMPRMKGLEALTQLKREGSESKMVLVTTITSNARMGRVKESGIDYFEKPVNSAILKKIIDAGIRDYCSRTGSSFCPDYSI